MVTTTTKKSNDGEQHPPVVLTVESARYDEDTRSVAGVSMEYDSEYEMFGVVTQAGTFVMFPRERVYEIVEYHDKRNGGDEE